ANANASIADINATLQQTSGRLDTAGQQTNDAIQAGKSAIEQVQGLLNDSALSPELTAPLEDTLQRLEAGNAASERLLVEFTSYNSENADTANAISQAAGAIDSAAQDTRAATQALRDALRGGLPSLNRTLSNVSAFTGSFAGSL